MTIRRYAIHERGTRLRRLQARTFFRSSSLGAFSSDADWETRGIVRQRPGPPDHSGRRAAARDTANTKPDRDPWQQAIPRIAPGRPPRKGDRARSHGRYGLMTSRSPQQSAQRSTVPTVTLSANKGETRKEKTLSVGRGRESKDGRRRRYEHERSAPLFWGGQIEVTAPTQHGCERRSGCVPGEARGYTATSSESQDP